MVEKLVEKRKSVPLLTNNGGKEASLDREEWMGYDQRWKNCDQHILQAFSATPDQAKYPTRRAMVEKHESVPLPTNNGGKEASLDREEWMGYDQRWKKQ